jgi:lysophospholipase L1-like esterase
MSGIVLRMSWLLAEVAVFYAASIFLMMPCAQAQSNVLAFGDSITYGVGDGLAPGSYVDEILESGPPRGYPQRLSSSSGGAVSNAGEPGERISTSGVYRLPGLVVGSDVDTVIIMEGVNDAIERTEGRQFRSALQRMINVVRAEGKQVIVATLPQPVASRQALAPYTHLYSAIVRDLSAANDVAMADIEKVFADSCASEINPCDLYNLPEGLHPNTKGHDAIANEMQSVLNGGGK